MEWLQKPKSVSLEKLKQNSEDAAAVAKVEAIADLIAVEWADFEIACEATRAAGKWIVNWDELGSWERRRW